MDPFFLSTVGIQCKQLLFIFLKRRSHTFFRYYANLSFPFKSQFTCASPMLCDHFLCLWSSSSHMFFLTLHDHFFELIWGRVCQILNHSDFIWTLENAWLETFNTTANSISVWKGSMIKSNKIKSNLQKPQCSKIMWHFDFIIFYFNLLNCTFKNFWRTRNTLLFSWLVVCLSLLIWDHFQRPIL